MTMVVEFERKCSRVRTLAILNAVRFAQDELFRRFKKPFYISIRPIRKLSQKHGIYGDCMDEDDRDFTIRVDVSIPLEDMISTMLHEMVHVHQYLGRRLIHKHNNMVVYNKVLYHWDMEYDTRPWEIEAHRVEQQLAEKYFA
jgi:hypothetical protein